MDSVLRHRPRVVVVGTTCCGKTTFARRLAKILDVPHVEIDTMYWLPGWTPRHESQFQDLVGQAVTGDRWVIDGNYSRLQDLIFTRATTSIWLNFSFPRSGD